MKRIILTSTFLLLLIASCDSPVGNNPTQKSTLSHAKAQVAPSKISYSKQPVQPDTARKAIFQQFKAENGNNWRIRWNQHTGLPASIFLGHTKKTYRGPAEEAARSFLADHDSLLGFGTLKHLKYVKTKEYKGARYVTFNEVVQGVPVYDAQYVIHLTPTGQVNMVNGSYYPNIKVSTGASISKSRAASAAKSDIKKPAGAILQTKVEKVIYRIKDQFHLVWNVNVTSKKPIMNRLYMIDAQSGTILDKQNGLMDVYTTGNTRASYSSDLFVRKLLTKVLTGNGKVYPTYPPGSSVTDKSLYRLNGNGYLTGTFAKSVNDEASRAYSGLESFQFAPSNTHFDEANLYYHIDRFRHNFVNNYTTDAGFTQVTAHAHAPIKDLNGDGFLDPNSYFDPNTKQLYFNDAYPPDNTNDFAKSDKVIYHEYSHDVIYHINSSIGDMGSRTTEEGGISEGTPDYWAGAFTGRKVILDYAVPYAKRDMANPTISTYSQYESQAPVEQHLGGEFFSSILWDIHNYIGASKTNTLVFKALHGISGGPDFLEFRDAMLSADNEAYSGNDAVTIQDTFADKGVGYYPKPTAYIDETPVLIAGQQWTLTGEASGGNPPYTYNWYYKSTADGTYQQASTHGSTYDYTAGSPPYDYIKLEVLDQYRFAEFERTIRIVGFSQ